MLRTSFFFFLRNSIPNWFAVPSRLDVWTLNWNKITFICSWPSLYGQSGHTDRNANSLRCVLVCVKVKVPPLQATKALRVGRGIALPNLRPRHWRWGWGGVSTTPRPLYPRGKTRYTLYRRLSGVQGPVWTGAANLVPSTGIRSPYRTARSESLYRLSYPGPSVTTV